MCARRFWLCVFAFLLLAACLVPATLWAEEPTAPEMSQSTEPGLVETSQLLIDSLIQLEAMQITRLNELSKANQDSANIGLSLNAVILNDEKNSGVLLKQSDILALLLAESVIAATTASQSSASVSDTLEPLTQDLSEYDKAVSRLERGESVWRFVACCGLGGMVGGTADGLRGALYGALAGAVGDGVYELGHRLKWW